MDKYRLTIESLPLTWREKFFDKFGGLFFIPLIPVIIGLIPLIILALLVGLFYENIIEKYFYKLIDKKRRSPEEKNPLQKLPSFISIKSMWEIEGLSDKIKRDYNLANNLVDELNLIQLETTVKIEGLRRLFANY